MHSYKELTRDIGRQLEAFRKGQADVHAGFRAMAAACHSDGALTNRTKELIATAIAVSARCQGCIGFHVKALKQLGVSREEFLEMLGVAVYMGGGPSLMTAAEAMQAWDEFSEAA